MRSDPCQPNFYFHKDGTDTNVTGQVQHHLKLENDLQIFRNYHLIIRSRVEFLTLNCRFDTVTPRNPTCPSTGMPLEFHRKKK